MLRLQIFTYGLVLLALSDFAAPARALTIETLFVPAGKIINGVGVAESPPSNTIGGGNLTSIVRAAADLWEGLIADEHTVTLNYGWTNTSADSSIAFHQGLSAQGDPRREVLGSLAFNSRYSSSAPFYLDPTPWVSEEFNGARHEFSDLGGGQVEVQREYFATDPTLARTKDLFSVAVHEIGHALGLAGWSHFTEETIEDGTIDLVEGAFAGTSIPVKGPHLAIPRANLTHEFHPLGSRLDITQVDLLAVCQLSQFQGCTLSERPMHPLGDSNGDNDVDGADYLGWQEIQSPLALQAFDLPDWQETYGSPLRDFGDYNHDRLFNGQDFLEWQSGASPSPLSDADLAMWESNFASIQFPAGDYNHDRTINGLDFLAWQKDLSPSNGGAADLAVWRGAYQPSVASAALEVVPEPAIATLLGAACVLACTLRVRI